MKTFFLTNSGSSGDGGRWGFLDLGDGERRAGDLDRVEGAEGACGSGGGDLDGTGGKGVLEEDGTEGIGVVFDGEAGGKGGGATLGA